MWNSRGIAYSNNYVRLSVSYLAVRIHLQIIFWRAGSFFGRDLVKSFKDTSKLFLLFFLHCGHYITPEEIKVKPATLQPEMPVAEESLAATGSGQNQPSTSASGLDYLDIPAFLRKQAD